MGFYCQYASATTLYYYYIIIIIIFYLFSLFFLFIGLFKQINYRPLSLDSGFNRLYQTNNVTQTFYT